MRVKVVRPFTDKRTGAESRRGATLDVEPRRAAELVKAGVAEAIDAFPAKEEPRPAKGKGRK